MQIWPIKNLNFEKTSRNLYNETKVKILKNIFLYISQQNLVPRMLSHRGKCSNIEILAKIEGKEAKFCSIIYEGHIRI
jgi:hypothetical protein